ncbi:potassium channel family protein, partial [Planctomycetota bacterium]
MIKKYTHSIGEFPYLKRLIYGLVLFVAIIITGTIGYHIIAGYSLFEGFYSTLITVATVEARDFGDNTPAKVLTVFLILVGMGNLLFLVSTFAAFFADGEFRRLLWRNKMDNEIKKLRDHVIVCGGLDEIGTYVIDELIKTHRQFVAVNESLGNINQKKVSLYVEGDPANDEVLNRAGIQNAIGVISILPEDKDNVFVTLTARGLNPDIRIVAKCVDSRTSEKLRKAGADSVVNPDLIGGMRIASELMRPTAVSFLDKMLRVQSKSAIRFEDMKITKGSELEGKTIKEAALSTKYSLLVVGARKKADEDFIYSPSSDHVLEEGSEVVLLGELDKINQVKK